MTTQLPPHLATYVDRLAVRHRSVPVDARADTPEVIKQLWFPVQPGDWITALAIVNCTNDTGIEVVNGKRTVTGDKILVGAGARLWVWDANEPGPTRPATRVNIGSHGTNVEPTLGGMGNHHVGLAVFGEYEVPATWVPGRNLAVALELDAHSSAWEKNWGQNVLKVEPSATLQVHHYGAREVPDAPGV